MTKSPPKGDGPFIRDEETQEIQIDGPAMRIQAPRDRCTLMMLRGSSPGSMLALKTGSTVIGRGQDADVRLDDEGLSRKHARVFKTQNRWFVEDLGSKNGCWLNNTRVQERAALEDGSYLQIGSSTLYTVSIQNAMEQEAALRMAQSAILDGLTQVHNRRHFQERLHQEVAYARRHQAPLSLLMFDVDHFKSVNDTHGHPAGDAVLRVLAKLLMRTVRREDLVARFGGEEFAVLARGTDPANARILADRIRKLVQRTEIPFEEGTLKITVSAGVATLRGEDAEGEQLLKSADDALYRAKANGRNRVEVGV